MTHIRKFVAFPPSASPTVLLDLDDHVLVTTQLGSSVTPPTRRYQSTPRTTAHGENLNSAYLNDREVRLEEKFVAGSDADDQVQFLHQLAQIVSRTGLLMWQDEGMPGPRFYVTKPADIAVIDSILVAKPTRDLSVKIPAEPFAFSEPITLTPFTVRNDPAAAVANPMLHVFEDIKGDAPTPMYWSYANDPDAAHRVLWASEALVGAGTTVLLYDDFNRVDSPTVVGNPPIGPAPEVRDGVAGILGHELYFSTATASTNSVVWETGAADGTFESRFTVQPSANASGLYLRSSSDENGIFVGDTAIFKNVAGAYTNLGSYTGGATFDDGDVCRVVLTGSNIKVYRQVGGDGDFTLIADITEATFQTVTKHGVATFNTTAPRWGWVKFTSSLSPSAPTAPYWQSLTSPVVKGLPTSYDTYTRADSATTMGTASPGGGTWTTQGPSTWGIQTNRAQCVTGLASDWSTAVIGSGSADTLIQATLTTQNNSGLVIRSNGANAGIAFLNNQAYDIATAGLGAPVGPAFSATFVSGDVMRVRCNGTTVRVYRQVGGTGAFTQVATFTSSLYLTNTKHGLALFNNTVTARWDDFYLGADALPINWTITDSTNGAAVSGSLRVISKVSSTTGSDLLVPTADTMLEWPNLPVGLYRVMVRVSDPNADDELLFWNRPPSTGTALLREEAAASALVVNTTANSDWYDLGVVAMPGGAPESDIMFGLDTGVTATALWNFGVYNPNNNAVGLDAIVLIPAGRPDTETLHGSATFPDTYTSKTVYLDGVNDRRYATGLPITAPTKRIRLMPTALSGELPELTPGAVNILHFFATAADPASPNRINDSKTLDTAITGKYYPKWIYDRPPP